MTEETPPQFSKHDESSASWYPEVHFRLEHVLWGVNSVVFYYTNQKGARTGEFMELSAIGKVVRVAANYSA